MNDNERQKITGILFTKKRKNDTIRKKKGELKMIDKSRELALKTIVKIEKEDGYTNIVLNEMIKENRKQLEEKDIAFISELVYGIITWKITLDEIIKKYSSIKLKKISIWIQNILRMGIYQIIFLDKIPKSAAVNESVNLAKRYGHKASSNFVNAILRKVKRKDYEELQKIENDIERISKTTSMPEWLIGELLHNRTIIEVEEICKILNQKPKINIRINRLKTDIEKLEQKENAGKEYWGNIKEELKKEKIKYKVIEEEMPEFLEIEKMKEIENQELFKKGYFTIQDISAGMAVKILCPKPKEIILDACAAPGGKTTYMAEMMNNQGKIIATDIHEHRLNLIKENAKRLGITIIETKQMDSTICQKEYIEKFDKILLDVPCLGIGVIKRKPDIKWQRKPQDVQEITAIQKRILAIASNYLKTGGELVYSTCSILKEENEDIINNFLQENQNFEIIKIKTPLGIFEKFKTKEGYLTIKPTKSNDGFFISKLRKK